MPVVIDTLIHSRRRTIALIVQKDGSLTVRAPLHMPLASIEQFVHKHSAWVLKKQSQMKASTGMRPRSFKEGEAFLFLGKEYPLKIVAAQRPSLIFSSGRFRLAQSALPKASQTFIRWYKLQARQLISERVASLSKVHHFTYGKVRISSATTRWGSCSSLGTLSFTWRLILAPAEIIDYVIIHELVHTRVRNHSHKFWQQVSLIMPDYPDRLSWLKKFGRTLDLDAE